MKVKILPSADSDLDQGYDFYERQTEGIGAYFLDSLFSDIDSLIISGGVHPIVHGQFHRLLSKRFPFAVYYQVHETTVHVHAVVDCRRNPAWIRRKLR
jgi:plasmid stabilization system protein ParE